MESVIITGIVEPEIKLW